MNLKGGDTPDHSKPSLCNTCQHAHNLVLERTGRITLCGVLETDNPTPLKEKVVSCSLYSFKSYSAGFSKMGPWEAVRRKSNNEITFMPPQYGHMRVIDDTGGEKKNG